MTTTDLQCSKVISIVWLMLTNESAAGFILSRVCSPSGNFSVVLTLLALSFSFLASIPFSGILHLQSTRLFPGQRKTMMANQLPIVLLPVSRV